MPDNTTPSPTMSGSSAPPAPLTRADFDYMLARLLRIDERSVRVETRLMRLLEHHGIDQHGQPLTTNEGSSA